VYEKTIWIVIPNENTKFKICENFVNAEKKALDMDPYSFYNAESGSDSVKIE